VEKINQQKGFQWINILWQPPNSPACNASELMWLYLKEYVKATFHVGETAEDVHSRTKDSLYGDLHGRRKGYNSEEKISKWQREYMNELCASIIDRDELKEVGIARDKSGNICIKKKLRDELIIGPNYFTIEEENLMDKFWINSTT
jgi:hypothetical protein